MLPSEITYKKLVLVYNDLVRTINKLGSCGGKVFTQKRIKQILREKYNGDTKRFGNEFLAFLLERIPELEEKFVEAKKEKEKRDQHEHFMSQAHEIATFDTAERKGYKKVWVYHETSTAVLCSILKYGLLARPRQKAFPDSSEGVFVHTGWIGDVDRFYLDRAIAVHGGEYATLMLVVPLSVLFTDSDDANLPSSRYQAVIYGDVPPDWIKAVIYKDELILPEQAMCYFECD